MGTSPHKHDLTDAVEARRVHVRGIVQGVGFRPFVYRLAHQHELRGWVLNAEDGVRIHLEGTAAQIDAFLHALRTAPPPLARITHLEATPAEVQHGDAFVVRTSTRCEHPTVRIAPDAATCTDCLRELFDPADRRYRYPYVNCTNCGPRYSIIHDLPYDRFRTTMRDWPMCPDCAREYEDPADRRFHAQPVACPACGPQYVLHGEAQPVARAYEAIERAARMLREGALVAVKGMGGYHLACDARNEAAVRALRERKYRKEKPFAVMVRDLDAARALAALSDEAETLLTSPASPIVLAPARTDLPGVAPGNRDLGLMLPYTPLHHLLFDAGAPDVLVLTSGNRSSEPIAYRDDEARARLAGLADAFLMGERPIARRLDDSVTRDGPGGPVILRRARGYAPGIVATLPSSRPLLAAGADLKNTVTLVVEGQALVSQHIGDLAHYPALEAFRTTIQDLLRMYEVPWDDLLVVHDAHPHYASTLHALELPGATRAVQHHRAHVASVLAERAAWDRAVVGFAFDGTGYGDDGSIWGGEVFAGSLTGGLHRVAHLRPALLPGGDAAARVPVQAAAGFLAPLEDLPDVTAPPFSFPPRYAQSLRLLDSDLRTFPTTSVGRLFDTVAALLGFTRTMTYEGQAAIWLEHVARTAPAVAPYPFPDLDFRPLLAAVIEDRRRARPIAEIARAFHRAVARSIVEMGRALCTTHGTDILVLSGGVFQNQLLLGDVRALLDDGADARLSVWTNHAVPPNDGGISLGQAALAATSGA